MKLLQRLLLLLLLVSGVPAPHVQAAFPPHTASTRQSEPVATDDVPVVSGAAARPAGRVYGATVRLRKAGALQKIRRLFRGPNKRLWLAAVLALFFGIYGVHRFYLGYNLEGALQVGGLFLGIALVLAGAIATYLSGTVGVSALAVLGIALLLGVQVWVLVDLVRILAGDLQPKNGHYTDE